MNIPWEIPPTEDDIRHVLRLLGDQASHPVYIHCSKGIERSGIAIAIYRIELMGWTPDRAVREMLDHGLAKAIRRHPTKKRVVDAVTDYAARGALPKEQRLP